MFTVCRRHHPSFWDEERRRVPYAYAALVLLGIGFGLWEEINVLAIGGGNYGLLIPLSVSLGAVAAGLVCAKVWFILEHSGTRTSGWCVQGFVLGVVLVLGYAALSRTGGTRAGVWLAAPAPALLLGMSIGRAGCYFAGCCRGRRVLGMSLQLAESLAAAFSGLIALVVINIKGLPQSGPVLLLSLGIYTLLRQILLGYRYNQHSWNGRLAAGWVSLVAIGTAIALLTMN